MKTIKEHAEGFRKSLTAKGFHKKDVSLSVAIFTHLATLDTLLFPAKPARIEMCRVQHRGGFDAQYSKPGGGHREHFAIFVPGLHESWQRSVCELPCDGRSKMTMSRFALIIAVHELRHRLQFRLKGLRKFNAWNYTKASSSFVRRVGRFVQLVVRHERKKMRKDGWPASFIRRRTNTDEFDALVIEYVLTHHPRRIRSRKRILKLLRTEAC
ncbi:MAG: hypothetical protein V4481_00900 [Patescibacteria group bacterium]